MEGVHWNVVGVGALEPTGCLHRDEEVTTEGVVFLPARHPKDWRGFSVDGGSTALGLSTGYFSGIGEGRPRMGGKLTPCQSGRAVIYVSDSVHPRELDGLLHCHSPPDGRSRGSD